MSASVLNPTKRADMSADMSADTFGSKHADLADMSGNTLVQTQWGLLLLYHLREHKKVQQVLHFRFLLDLFL